MEPPATPFWFKQRQCKLEPAGDHTLKATGPNLGEAFLHIERDAEGRWRAAFRRAADGPDVSATAPEMKTEKEAWEAAFELYRLQMIV